MYWSKFSWESWKFTHWESQVQKNNMLENTCCAIHLFINARPKPSNSVMFQYYNNSFFFPSSSTGCCMNVVVLRVIAQLEVLVLLFFSICLLTFASGLADPEWINFTNFTVLWCQFSNSGSLTRCYIQYSKKKTWTKHWVERCLSLTQNVADIYSDVTSDAAANVRSESEGRWTFCLLRSSNTRSCDGWQPAQHQPMCRA